MVRKIQDLIYILRGRGCPPPYRCQKCILQYFIIPEIPTYLPQKKFFYEILEPADAARPFRSLTLAAPNVSIFPSVSLSLSLKHLSKKLYGWVSLSVTRFGEILTLLQDFKVSGHFLRIYLEFGKMLNLLWQIFHANGQIFNASNGQI